MSWHLTYTWFANHRQPGKSVIWAIFLNKIGFVTSYWERIERIWLEWAKVVFCGGVHVGRRVGLGFLCFRFVFLIVHNDKGIYKWFCFPRSLFIDFLIVYFFIVMWFPILFSFLELLKCCIELIFLFLFHSHTGRRSILFMYSQLPF